MNIKNISNILIGFLLLTTACDPIEDRDSLVNSFDPDNVELEVIQSTPGGNGLSIRMNTPGITGYWDYNIDKKFTDRVEVDYPIPGKSTFTFHVATGFVPNGDFTKVETFSKSIDVQIDVLDQPLPSAYYDLVGENLEGKKWVMDRDRGVYWYMSPPNDATAWAGFWWNAGDCCPPSDVDGSMTFDLNGAANYTYKTSATDAGLAGGFKFNADYTKLSFVDQPILGYDAARVNADSQYTIISLTAEELILYTPTNGGGTGWVWIFIPAA